MSSLPPLGLRGWTPDDLGSLPALPGGFTWARPNYGYNCSPAGHVDVVCAGQAVARIVPLVNGKGWLAATGEHRNDLDRRHGLWCRTFDRAVDYVSGWVSKYDGAIRDEAEAHYRELLSRHTHRIQS